MFIMHTILPFSRQLYCPYKLHFGEMKWRLSPAHLHNTSYIFPASIVPPDTHAHKQTHSHMCSPCSGLQGRVLSGRSQLPWTLCHSHTQSSTACLRPGTSHPTPAGHVECGDHLAHPDSVTQTHTQKKANICTSILAYINIYFLIFIFYQIINYFLAVYIVYCLSKANACYTVPTL